MTAYLTGRISRPLAILAVGLFVATAIVVTAVPTGGNAFAAAAGERVLLASAMPMPRPNPLRAGSARPKLVAEADAIGALITGGDSNELNATEDSDAPQATGTDTTALPAPPPPTKGSGGKPYNAVGLKLALKLLDDNDPAGATLAVYSLPDRIDIKIIEWLIATGSYTGVSAATMADLSRKFSGWPGQSLMRLRYEQALAREKPAPDVVIAALGGSKPASDDATLLLARAYVAVGRKDDATNLIRPFWRNQNFSEGIEKALLDDFSGLLRTADHKWRMDRLIYSERGGEALRVAKLLSKDQQALAKGVLAVVGEKAKAAATLETVPASVRKDHLYTYARIQLLRRAGKITEAGNLLASTSRDPATLVSPDAWWVERRMISRLLVEARNPKLAYQLAAGHSNESAALQAEAEFHAGWYALEYLRDPQTAVRHFASIAKVSTMALSLSRAEYWLGRSYQAAGNKSAAGEHYQIAARYQTTFYGQLAMARLGGKNLSISQPPAAGKNLAASFADRELVQVIRHLTTVGHNERAAMFYRYLAETLTDPSEMAMLALMAERDGKHPLALQIGKTALSRGMAVDALAFPTAAIPAGAKTPRVERPMVYAIARQESAFNPAAVSRAGALGLLQLMPATAKETAKVVGLPYNKGGLTSDPGYNATLGAAYLGKLVDTFDGSYVMTFAAYNAGASRVRDWVKRYGDPRDPRVDVVNWIESIPFTETRNYVQRIMENLQVYRARLGQPQLVIESDLRRGAGS